MGLKFNTTLTNYAFEIAPETASDVASFLSPTVNVASYAGSYKDFADKQAYQVIDARRGIGQQAKRIAFDVGTKSFNLQSYALDAPIDDIERTQAQSLDPLFLEKQKIKYLVKTGNNSHQAAVIDAAKTVSSTATIDLTNAAVDPVSTIDGYIATAADNFGFPPNRILISFSGWVKLRNHPKVTARTGYVTDVGVSTDMIKAMFVYPVEIMVSTLVFDANKLGAAASRSNKVGTDMFLFYSNPNPDPLDASFMKTFRLSDRGVGDVRVYREDASRSDVYALDWYEQVVIVGPTLGQRFVLTLS